MNDDRGIQSVPLERVTTPQGLVEFADLGRGSPILYFHGTGAGADAVAALEQPLIDDGFRLLIPHRPGYFGTPLKGNRTSSDCANLAARLLDSLGIEQVAVLGMSSGAMAAAAFASIHPTRTSALVLECAMSHPITATRWMPRRFAWTFPLMKHRTIGRPLFRLAYQIEVSWVKFSPNHLIAHTAGERKPEIVHDKTAQSLLPQLVDAAKACSQQPAGVENDYALLFGERWLQPGAIRCPTLIIHDLADPVATPPHVEWTIQCIPQAQLCELHLGGHLIWFGKDSQTMRRRRREFLSALSAGRRTT